MSEATLFDPGPPDSKLTPRQQEAVEFIGRFPGGVHSDELGAHLHEWAGHHDAGTRCDWCAQSGRAVAEALYSKGRIRRGRGIYRPLHVRTSTVPYGEFPAGF